MKSKKPRFSFPSQTISHNETHWNTSECDAGSESLRRRHKQMDRTIHHQGSGWEVVYIIIACFRRSFDSTMYRVEKCCQKSTFKFLQTCLYDVLTLVGTIQLPFFNPFEPISINEFSCNFGLACGSSLQYKEVEMFCTAHATDVNAESKEESLIIRDDYHTNNKPIICWQLASDIHNRWKHCRYRRPH